MPDERAVQREGGHGFVVLRGVLFFALLAFLVIYFLSDAWIEAFLFPQ